MSASAGQVWGGRILLLAVSAVLFYKGWRMNKRSRSSGEIGNLFDAGGFVGLLIGLAIALLVRSLPWWIRKSFMIAFGVICLILIFYVQ